MKYLKYLLFLFIVFITPNVLAYDYDVTNSITAPTGPSTAGRYLGLEIYNSGLQNSYSVNTRYNGTLSEIIFNLPLPSTAGQCFATNMDYTITMEMATSDWRNHFATPFVSWYSGGDNWKSSNVTFVSMKKIYFKFKIPSTETSCTDFVYVRLRSPSVSSTAFTGTTNWNLSKVTLTDGFSSSGGSGGGSGGGSNVDPNQNVIDNANENTENIIDNNNTNTDKVIDNQNKLLGDCLKNLMNDNIILSLLNVTQQGNTFTQIQADSSLTLQLMAQSWNNSSYVDILDRTQITSTGDYRLSFTKTSDFNIVVFKLNGLTIDTGVRLDVSSLENGKTYYLSSTFRNITQGSIKFSINTLYDVNSTDYLAWDVEYCKSKIDSTNDILSNPNIDSGLGSDFFNNFSSQDFGLSQIITLPLTTIQSLANTSCVSLNIPIPFTNSTIPLPCMTQVYQTYIPTIFNIWQVVSFGIIAYFICIDIVHLVKGFKDPDSDKVEVLDL